MIDLVMPIWITDEETLDITKSALASLEASDADIRPIIIDNGSTIGGGYLRDIASIYVRNRNNLGYARAVNQGLKLAGKYVAVANNDIRVSPNWWTVASDIFAQSDNIGSVHFRMIPYTQVFHYGNDIWPEGKERWCSSSFFVMRNVQLYDEHYLNSYDDWDYWRRFRKEWCTAYTNKAEYQHLDSHTQEKVENRSKNDIKNREYYMSKWGETPETWLMRTYPDQMLTDWKPFP